MADPFIGEVRLNAFNFAPRDWATCDGQILNVSQYQALYSLLGNNYGGTSPSTFALPDLRGRTPICFGVSPEQTVYNIGVKAGTENVTLTTQSMPSHNHQCSSVAVDGNKPVPSGNFYAQSTSGVSIYGNPTSLTPLHPATISSAGSGQAHNNMQPSLVLSFCIALVGTYPPRN